MDNLDPSEVHDLVRALYKVSRSLFWWFESPMKLRAQTRWMRILLNAISSCFSAISQSSSVQRQVLVYRTPAFMCSPPYLRVLSVEFGRRSEERERAHAKDGDRYDGGSA